MSIICLGDSLTYGYLLPPSQSWVSQLHEITHLNFINKGIPGDTTLNMKRRLSSDVLLQKPSRVLFMGGTNDLFTGRSVTETLQTIDEIVQRCLEKEIPVILLTPLPVNERVRIKRLFGSADYHKVNQELAALRLKLTDYGKAHHLPVINTGEVIATLPDLENLYLSDGIHVKSEVYQLIAKTIAQSDLL